MQHMTKENIALCIGGTSKNIYPQCFVSNTIVSKHFVTGETYVLPLYCDDVLIGKKYYNLKEEVIRLISKKIKLKYTASEISEFDSFCGKDIFAYVYAILHSTKYRKTFEEQLKNDFPRIPFVDNPELFKKYAEIGSELIILHLSKYNDLNPYCSFELEDINKIEKIVYKDEKIYINKKQYFSSIKKNIWEWYIGGYQPLQKWLKDRKGDNLSVDEINEYLHIIFVLEKTINLIGEIDKIDVDF